jgi:SagB-type dehydrogenase family enzyme
MTAGAAEIIRLPKPATEGEMSLEKTLAHRRSVRNYADEALSLKQISQMLWAAQGEIDSRGFRTAPSAGALYPLEVFVAAGNVEALSPGIYRYNPETHELVQTSEGDRRNDLRRGALNQSAVSRAPAVFVFGAVFERVTGKYGKRGVQYAFMEAGHAAQNLCLQAVSLDLASVPMGAFDDKTIQRILNAEKDIRPVYLVPVGKAAK